MTTTSVTSTTAKRAASAAEAGGPGDIVVESSDRLLEGVGLGGLGAEQASAMPTGLARMVELARALAMAPQVLLLDEPGSGLDDAESEALGEAGGVDVHDHVDERLHLRGLAGVADVAQGGAEILQDGLHLVEGGLVAGTHEIERAVAGLRDG